LLTEFGDCSKQEKVQIGQNRSGDNSSSRTQRGSPPHYEHILKLFEDGILDHRVDNEHQRRANSAHKAKEAISSEYVLNSLKDRQGPNFSGGGCGQG
jgi:hypothetical protein